MKKTTNYRAIIITGVLVLLGIILNAVANIFTLVKQMQDIGGQLNSLGGWVNMLEVIFITTLFVVVVLKLESSVIIKALLIGFTPVLILLAMLGANIIETASLIVCLSVVYFRTSALQNRYIKLSLGLVSVGLVVSFLEANLQGYVVKYIAILPNMFTEVYSIWDIMIGLGLFAMAAIGQLELTKYIVLKNSYRRYARR